MSTEGGEHSGRPKEFEYLWRLFIMFNDYDSNYEWNIITVSYLLPWDVRYHHNEFVEKKIVFQSVGYELIMFAFHGCKKWADS
ncbi:hypothetical protein GWI33_000685 [Rhynchophorus ferrugineus]|uniref:Uncharacterized protein n=1 Tax=Rhynchophorus ferrugineus TaxID=354439 RepID=A0A834HNP5_RHYFE|nr:hypothetical protein GWI33_000685 [Rhynchophorus ferrugineus]